MTAAMTATLLLACPVCGQGAPGTESAILVMSGILSVLPLLMVGGIVTWIFLRHRARDAENAGPDTGAAPARARSARGVSGDNAPDVEAATATAAGEDLPGRSARRLYRPRPS